VFCNPLIISSISKFTLGSFNTYPLLEVSSKSLPLFPSVLEALSLSPSFFAPLEIMFPCFDAGLDFGIIPAGFNATLEFLTGFTHLSEIAPHAYPLILDLAEAILLHRDVAHPIAQKRLHVLDASPNVSLHAFHLHLGH
jgi:hypothetical protein